MRRSKRGKKNPYNWCVLYENLNETTPLVYCTNGDHSLVFILYDPGKTPNYKVIKWAMERNSQATHEYNAYVKVSKMSEDCKSKFAKIYNLDSEFARKSKERKLDEIVNYYVSNHSNRDFIDEEELLTSLKKIISKQCEIPSEFGSGNKKTLSRVFELELYEGDMRGEDNKLEKFIQDITKNCINPNKLEGIEALGKNIFYKGDKYVLGDLGT